MATFSSNKRASGVRYTAQIRIKRGGAVVYSESKTFGSDGDSRRWAAKREAELADKTVLKWAIAGTASVGEVLRWYLDDFDGATKFGVSKLSHINFLIAHDVSKLDVMKLTSGEMVSHARQRIESGAGPSTVNNDFIWLRNAFRSARIGRDLPIDMQALDDAAFLMRREGLIAKSKSRDRRPTLAELERILEFESSPDARATIPMVEVVLFALFSSRRQAEITRLRWDDLDESRHRVLVRDMKHPREKIDTWCFLTDEAWAIIQRQPRVAVEIFPYNARSVGTRFGRICKFLEIEDLRFHDLRHECASWLFECGRDIASVSGFTGHRSWESLKRYTHIRERDHFDRYKDWSWRPVSDERN